MEFVDWVGLAGALLLLLALVPAYLRRLPVGAAAVYLMVGLGLSPVGLDLLRLDARHAQPWLEHLTEVAVVISLFIGGLKMRLPLRHSAWVPALLLAGPGMLLSIIGVALVAHFALGLSVPLAILLGAILAPTDPVLAGAVAVSDAADHDRMRYGLSGEAGLNDGLAFPFVVFALLWGQHGGIGDWTFTWALHRLLWAVPAALVLGYLAGNWLGMLAIWLRGRLPDTGAPNNFLALGLVAFAYYLAETVGAWGFLAAFAAGVGLRHTELRASGTARRINPVEDAHAYDHPPAETLVGTRPNASTAPPPATVAGTVVFDSISFGNTLERLLEVLLVVVVGVGVAEHWDVRAVPIALVLFAVIRPLSTHLLLISSRSSLTQRWLLGWFGIRGIGSLYYLSYAINQNLTHEAATDAAGLTFSVVALSILVHGVSVQPLLERYERSLERRRN